MPTEQDKTLAALQIAIQMEVEGKEHYQKASQESGNELGRKLLLRLANEEDIHRLRFEQIYNAIRDKKAWPTTDFQPEGGQRLRTIFAQATAATGPRTAALATELDAVQMAMEMENKTYDYYTRQGEIATHDAERDFYRAVAAEEKEHHLILLDYYEYLKDPAGWFVRKEHPSLDGG